jgi:hypothetical protein
MVDIAAAHLSPSRVVQELLWKALTEQRRLKP